MSIPRIRYTDHDGTRKIDTYYIHAPEPQTPISETLAAINELHAAGRFTHFGLCNCTAEQVEAFHAHCVAQGYVLPTVYQGGYNPFSRGVETSLFPVLRKLGMRFYAYTPIAGGFLAKPVQQMAEGKGVGRWAPVGDPGAVFNKVYNKPLLREGLAMWHEAAKKTGVPPAEMAYRYMAYHSLLRGDLGDALIAGATTSEQLEQTMEGIQRGPLPQEAVERINKIWEHIKTEAPMSLMEGM